MTKCIVTGSGEMSTPQVPIVFKYFLESVLPPVGRVSTGTASTQPRDYDNVQLLRKGYGGGYDVMYAWDAKAPTGGLVYLGHWNDGVVA